MHQHGQVFALTTTAATGDPLWAFRYRPAGRGSKRVQKGGFPSEDAAARARDRALRRLQRGAGSARPLTFGELAAEYLAQHQAEPETVDKLRWLLSTSRAAFGDKAIDAIHGRDVAAWRMTLAAGHRFEAPKPCAESSRAP